MKLLSLRERMNNWLDQPVKSRVANCFISHPKKFGLGLMLSIPILYYGINDIVLPAFQRYRENAVIEQRIAEQKAITNLPESIYSLADEQFKAYRSSKPVCFHKSETGFDLEAKIGENYNLFINNEVDNTCVQIQSTKVKQFNIGDYQLATIMMIDPRGNIQSISIYHSRPFNENSPEGWIGRGVPLLEMIKPREGGGLVINDYFIRGWGMNELYPNLQFPAQYQTLVQEIIKDMPIIPSN